MSKKSLIEREKKRKLLFNKYLFIRKSLKEKLISTTSLEEKFIYSSSLQRLPRNSSFSRLLSSIFFFFELN